MRGTLAAHPPRATPCGGARSVSKKVRGGFLREGELNQWLKRLESDPDDWLVGKAVAIAIRRRARPGVNITMQQLCHLAGGLHWKTVMAALYRMRGSGRLRFSKIGEDLDSSATKGTGDTQNRERDDGNRSRRQA
jgi:hypothetical protein